MKNIHTLIQDPLQLRKHLLESALDSTQAMKSVETVKSMETDSLVFRKELRLMMKTLKNSVQKLQTALPPLPSEFNTPSREPESEKKTLMAKERIPVSEKVTLFAKEHVREDLDDIKQRISTLRKQRKV
jgi:hypothetical protein